MKHGLTLRHGRIELHDGDHAFRLVADSFALQPGQTVALTGASGSGKTLFLELLGLLRSPEGGTEYTCSGENLIDLWKDGPRSAALARRRGGLFGFVPQTGALMPFLTVAENIALTQNVTKRQDASWCTHLMDRARADIIRQHDARQPVNRAATAGVHRTSPRASTGLYHCR